MGMYNLFHGFDAAAPALVAILGFSGVSGFGRFRDAYVSEDGTRIHVLTRNGGGNRHCLHDKTKDCQDSACFGCIITHRLPQHRYYILDRDDEFDSTYAIVEFSVPEEARDFCLALRAAGPPLTLRQKTEQLLNELEKKPR